MNDQAADFGISEIEYCIDGRDNSFSSSDTPALKDCGDFCKLDETIESMDEEDVIGQIECPNGMMITRYTKFCTPSGDEGIGGCTDLPSEDCLEEFEESCCEIQ